MNELAGQHMESSLGITRRRQIMNELAGQHSGIVVRNNKAETNNE
jgi:hypothetical protein